MMRLMPALVITPDEVDFVIEALDGSMAEIMKKGGLKQPVIARSDRDEAISSEFILVFHSPPPA